MEFGCASRLQSVGTPANPVIRSFNSVLHDFAGEHKINQDYRSALLECGHELIHARIKTKWKTAKILSLDVIPKYVETIGLPPSRWCD